MAKIPETLEVKISAAEAIEMVKKAMEDMRCKNCRHWDDGKCFSDIDDSDLLESDPDFGRIHFASKGETLEIEE